MGNWDKKYHAKSSMQPRPGQYALFIGRWQPLHEGHMTMFRECIKDGRRVAIAIRSMEQDQSNPYTPEQILANIKEKLGPEIEAGDITAFIIPDICSVEFGRGVGYDIIEWIPPKKIADISATKIRNNMRESYKGPTPESKAG